MPYTGGVFISDWISVYIVITGQLEDPNGVAWL